MPTALKQVGEEAEDCRREAKKRLGEDVDNEQAEDEDPRRGKARRALMAHDER